MNANLSEIRRSRDTVQLIYKDNYGNTTDVKNYDGVLARVILDVAEYADKVNKTHQSEVQT